MEEVKEKTQKVLVDFKEIETMLFKGLKEACRDAHRFSGKINEQIEPEYIVTVNIAKSLNEINSANSSFGSPLIIKVEEDTRVFASECVPLILFEDIFDSTFREFHNSDRNGKIDIAVYEVSNTGSGFENRIPKCPVEVKKFTPSRGEILKDLYRNFEYLQVKDKTGNNRLEKAYLVFLAHDKECLFETNKDKGKERLKKFYTALTKSFSDSLKEHNIILRIETETVDENLFADNKFEGQDPDFISDRAYESFHHVGVLMTLERLTKPK